MRVLEVAAATSLDGGGEKHVADLLRRLPAAGVQVALAAPPAGGLWELAASLGVPSFATPIEHGFTARAFAGFRAALAALAPDVVHAHGSRAAAFARAADPLARRRVVYTLHGIHADQGSPARRGILLGLERALRPRTARFVAVSRANRDKGARLGILDPTRTAVVPNGIEFPLPDADRGVFRRELGVAEGRPLVLSVGRLDVPKDQATLLRAWGRLGAGHPDAVLALVGAGHLEEELHAVAREEGLGERVRFVRPRRDLASVYGDADLFVLSSLWEGLPYVLLEAMAYGLPVVATAVDGIPEVVAAGETGLLVAAADPEALAGALAQLLAAPAGRHAMGAAGAARVRDLFTIDAMVAGVVRVYEEVPGGA